MQATEIDGLRESYDKVHSLTSVKDLDLSNHVLHFCKCYPEIGRLALADLLMQAANDAKDAKNMSDKEMLALMKSTLALVSDGKVQSMFYRVVATMVNPAGTSSPILPYYMAPTPGGLQGPRALPIVAEELRYFRGDCPLSDDAVAGPEPLTEVPAKLTSNAQKVGFWNPEPNSPYWEKKWIEGIQMSMLFVSVHV